MYRKALFTAGVALTLAASPSLAADQARLDEVLIIGTVEDARTLPGSGAVIGKEQLGNEVITDIHQVLKTVPGIYIREEEGSGLRPNIGIRGATAERSQKITLLEDGVPIAPAPYASPAAYYFPTTLRMSGIEVIKGAPLLQHGPQTTGGVLNMISTPIPEEIGGSLTVGAGSHESSDIHAAYGGTSGQWGFLLETVERNSGGFKDIDRSNRDSGFHISDYVGKLRWSSDNGPRQSALLKVQHSTEVSNASYLGLSAADFAADPNRRYGLSGIDQMNNRHTGVNLSYSRELADNLDVTATLYRNDFSRNWFKLGGGGALVKAADAGDAGDAGAQGILDGTVDTTGLKYKHNSRDYYAQGLQLDFDLALGAHQLALGTRVHRDEMDRFQPTDIYDQVNGSLVFQQTKAPAGSDDRLEESEALSFWLLDDWQVTDKLNLNLALRLEDVDSKQTTTGVKTSSNSTQELLPGASFTYDLTPRVQVLGGVHRGFSPLGGGAKPHEDPETSVNYELGARYSQDDLFLEAIGFYSDFSNKTENCSVGSPCSNGATAGTFVTGEAVISGLELQANERFRAGSFSIPVNLAYTFTQAEISKDNAASGFEKGDELKDVPEHIFSARVGLEHAGGWDNYAVAKYLDELHTKVGSEQTTDSLFVVDYISQYRLKEDTRVFLKVENVFDTQKVVAHVPDGARPNKPQSIMVGMTLDF